jgi:hypothetical protein
MYQSSQGLTQLAVRKAELRAEAERIRSEVRRNAAALLPVVETVEMGLRIGRGIRTAGLVVENVAGICRAISSR